MHRGHPCRRQYTSHIVYEAKIVYEFTSGGNHERNPARKNVKHLVTCDADDRLLDGVNVFIRDGVIESIGQNEETAADVIDASNMVMYPGLINTHHHYIRHSAGIYHRYRTWNYFHG